jgi:hypothetical protein
LEKEIENLSTAERSSVSSYALESSRRRDMTSSAAQKNSVVKTHKAALSAGSLALSRDPPLSAESVQAPRSESGEGFALPAISRYGNGAVVIADDRFTKVNRTNTRKEIPNIVVTSGKKVMIHMNGVNRSHWPRSL